MKIVMLSGGSGKRLWPLSNDSRSKQFLKVLRNEQGNLESMVQRVKRQIANFFPDNDIFIATSKSQVDMIETQLGKDVTVLVEPERRDTFPAIALAATYLYSVEGVGLDEVICVLPVDPYVEEQFFESILSLENAINLSGAELALMGVKPTYPSEKYGYIVPSKEEQVNQTFYKVSHFVEKPEGRIAQNLISQNAYWNCGVFAFKLDKIITRLESKGLPVTYDQLLNTYHTLIKTSFDYEIVEKTNDIVFVPYAGDWKDLGTWNTLTEEMRKHLIGRGYISEDSINTHLINELDIPVTVLGISNAIVAVSPDGILVSDKVSSPKVKEAIKDFNQITMYEERRWGFYRVLDYTKKDNEEVLTRRIGIRKDKNLSYQYHKKRKEIWTVMSGEGELVLEGINTVIRAGDVIQINPLEKHAVKALTDLEFIEVQIGTELTEEDIFRVCMTWDELKQLNI